MLTLYDPSLIYNTPNTLDDGVLVCTVEGGVVSSGVVVATGEVHEASL